MIEPHGDLDRDKKLPDMNQQCTRGPSLAIFSGTLRAHFETMFDEGIRWAIETGSGPEDTPVFIEAGDFLAITDRDGATVFEGTIKPDTETGKIPRFPTDPSFMQQTAHGLWILWTQDGFEANEWAKIFISGQHEGRLVKKLP